MCHVNIHQWNQSDFSVALKLACHVYLLERSAWIATWHHMWYDTLSISFHPVLARQLMWVYDESNVGHTKLRFIIIMGTILVWHWNWCAVLNYHQIGLHDLSCDTECHMTPSLVVTQWLQDNIYGWMMNRVDHTKSDVWWSFKFQPSSENPKSSQQKVSTTKHSSFITTWINQNFIPRHNCLVHFVSAS